MTLPELHRRLLAERLDAMLAVPASLDPDMVDRHFPEAVGANGRNTYPNGSTLRIHRGSDARPGSLEGYLLDIAVLLTPWPASTMAELRMRLLRRGGVLFAPFEVEAPRYAVGVDHGAGDDRHVEVLVQVRDDGSLRLIDSGARKADPASATLHEGESA